MPFSVIALQSNVTRICLEGGLDASTVEGLRPELRNVARRSPPRTGVVRRPASVR